MDSGRKCDERPICAFISAVMPGDLEKHQGNIGDVAEPSSDDEMEPRSRKVDTDPPEPSQRRVDQCTRHHADRPREGQLAPPLYRPCSVSLTALDMCVIAKENAVASHSLDPQADQATRQHTDTAGEIP